MIATSIWDNTEIDTLSDEIRKQIAQGVYQYILENWDKCVKTTNTKNGNRYETLFEIRL